MTHFCRGNAAVGIKRKNDGNNSQYSLFRTLQKYCVVSSDLLTYISSFPFQYLLK
jgi:hypothetical protein